MEKNLFMLSLMQMLFPPMKRKHLPNVMVQSRSCSNKKHINRDKAKKRRLMARDSRRINRN